MLVGIHDIYLPYDYPAFIVERYYSEQYLLAAYLLSGSARFETIFPAWHVWQAETFRATLAALWEHPEVERHGAAYWIETT